MVDLNRLVNWRRYLHQNPELAFQEFRTSEYIEQELNALGIETARVIPTGVIGVINQESSGPVVALRADIDALPLQDAKEVEYKSRNKGVIHACGHDGHVAILLETARLLKERQAELPGRVVLIFQPAEEKPPGGALCVIGQGWLENVDWVFGLHLWAGLPSGYIGLKTGPVMANADEFTIKVKGKGGHASKPQDSIDSVFVACQIVNTLHSVVSRSVNPVEPAVLSIGTIHGGTAFNIIAQETEITGTYRSFSEHTRSLIETRIEEIAKSVCAAHKAECEVICSRGYPAVINHQAGIDILTQAVTNKLGREKILEPELNLGGEDFAYYLLNTAGAYMFVGASTCNFVPHHHPEFDFAEESMLPAVEVMVEAVKLAMAAKVRG